LVNNEEEIYSIMFTSLKHPVRRKILRMLADKPMTFMEMVDHLGVSSSHLTYHLESLGELVSKTENGRYRLSSFGQATVSAMKGVEEVPVYDSKRRLKLPLKWKATLALLLIMVLLLASMSTLQFLALDKMDGLRAENQQLLSWGISTNKVVNLLQNIAHIDTSKYVVKLLDNTVQYRQDFNVPEELIKYSLTSGQSSSVADFRFRSNHFSRYQLILTEESEIHTTTHAMDVLEIAKGALEGYRVYSGDTYLDDMTTLLSQISKVEDATITQGNLKLKIITTGDTTDFLWMYTTQGIDFSAKSLRMTFTGKVLTTMIDGYFLFTVGNTNLAINQDNAIQIAKNHAKTLTWTINGQQIMGFTAVDSPVSVDLIPHPRANSVALIPYWYVTLRLDQTYVGGINQIAIGVYADNGEIGDVQMLTR
jgi:DNA-binding transcriptional ArsR family regulator